MMGPAELRGWFPQLHLRTRSAETMPLSATAHTPRTGLILTGGGARAAYQVGVLAAIAQLRRDAGVQGPNPFPVIAGTSAGAINAATLACQADEFDAAVDGLVQIWRNIHVEQVYAADSLGVIRTGARWMTMMSLGWALARWRRSKPRSLLDNEPLSHLLQRWIRFDRLEAMLDSEHLEALAISGSSYTSGQHVTFYQTHKPYQPWLRSQRIAVRASWASSTCWLLRPFPSSSRPSSWNSTVSWSGSATAPCGRAHRSRPRCIWAPNACWSLARAACTSRRAGG